MNYLVLLSIIPSFLIGTFLYKKDKIEKEPFKNIVFAIGCGVISGILVLLFSKFLNISLYNKDLLNLTKAVFYLAFIEEVFKFLTVYIFIYNFKNYDYFYDGIIYTCFMATGFAIFENILYSSVITDFNTLFLRSIITIPGHIFYGVFMGEYISRAKEYSYKNKFFDEFKMLLMAVFIPTILHGFFNYCLFNDTDIAFIFFVIFLLILNYTSYKKVKDISKSDYKFNKK